MDLSRMHTFRIQYLSNLFLGTSKALLNPANMIKPNAPYLALLGNIGRAHCPETLDFLKWSQSKFQRIYWVPGPLEYSSINRFWNTQADETYRFLQDHNLKKITFCQKYQEPVANLNIIATPAWHLGFTNPDVGHLLDWKHNKLTLKQIFDLQVDEYKYIIRHAENQSMPTLLLTYSPISYNLIQNKNILIHLHGTGYSGDDQSVCGGADPWTGINSATSPHFKQDVFVEFQTSVPKYY
jgi:hypothetical protein